LANSARTALNHSDDGGQPGGVSDINGMLLVSSPLAVMLPLGLGMVNVHLGFAGLYYEQRAVWKVLGLTELFAEVKPTLPILLQ